MAHVKPLNDKEHKLTLRLVSNVVESAAREISIQRGFTAEQKAERQAILILCCEAVSMEYVN